MIIHGDCREEMAKIPSASVDAVITDPPYAMVNRPYGKLTEKQWHAMMRDVVQECKRILKPKGSAVFILQPNSEKIGKMRLWLWEFMLETAKSWNLIQDIYWWNYTTPPNAHVVHGLCRPSIKYMLWFGPSDCYRNQDAILWDESQGNAAHRASNRISRRTSPSGHGVNDVQAASAAVKRGGVTPFNLILHSPRNQVGHSAETSLWLCKWWMGYLTKPGGLVVDPFNGSGTMGIAAKQLGREYIGIEQHEHYCKLSRERIEAIK